MYQIQINNVRKEQEQQMAQTQEQMSRALSSQLETTKMEYVVAFQRERETHHGVVRELMERMNQLKLMVNNRSGDPGGGVSSASAPSLAIHTALPNATSSVPSTAEGLQPAAAFQGYHPSEPLPPAASCPKFGAPAGFSGPAGGGGGAGGGAGGMGGGPFNGTDVLPDFTGNPSEQPEGARWRWRRWWSSTAAPIRPISSSSLRDDSPGGRARKRSREKTNSARKKKKRGPGVEIAGVSKKLMPLPF